MKNRLAAFSRRIIPYNPEFRKLPLVKSVNAALLLQQLDFWFDKHESFWKFIEAAPNHKFYNEGDSWTEELGFSKDEFRTAFSQIGIVYKSKSQFMEAADKFVESGVEYYYASYIDRKNNLTYYVRNDKLLDRELSKLIGAQSRATADRPERAVPNETVESTPTAAPIVTFEPPKTRKAPKRSAEEFEAEREAKAEEKRLRAEAKAQAEREKQEQLERDNQWRYELFGGKDRYMSFNAWFWGTYMKENAGLSNPGMFYSIMLNSLRDGGEKYRYIISMFEVTQQKEAEAAKAAQEQQKITEVSEEEFSYEQVLNLLSPEESDALEAAGLEPETYDMLVRRLPFQVHEMRMRCIGLEAERQKIRNERKAREQRIVGQS